MKKIISLIFSFIMICIPLTACKGTPVSSEFPTPTVSSEVSSGGNTVSVYDPLQTPWRVPTYPPSPTATPRATDEPKPTYTPEPMPTVNTEMYPYGMQQSHDFYYNVYFRKENESKYTKRPSDFSTESKFYEYLYDYSEKHVKEIIENLNKADRFYMKVNSLFPNEYEEYGDQLNQRWCTDIIANDFYFVIDDKETLDTIKGILSRVTFERDTLFEYYESTEDMPATFAGGRVGQADMGDPFHIYYVPDDLIETRPNTWKDNFYVCPIVRKGIGIHISSYGSKFFYRYGNSIYYNTLIAKVSDADNETLVKLGTKIENRMKEKLVKILNSEQSNPILDMS